MTVRRSYEDSCRGLLTRRWIEDIPALLSRSPRHDDEVLGVSFFRTQVIDDDFSNLTLPRTYIERTEISRMSFRNTDLSESTLCFNAFVEVDFTGCRLENCDLRASTFNGVVFVLADLRTADLRRSTFDECDFSGASLRGARLTRAQSRKMRLSKHQTESVAWCDDDGDEPGGG